MNKNYSLKHLNYDKILSLKQKQIIYSDRPVVHNKIRKLGFFILKEGLFKTIRKIQSKRSDLLKLTYYITILEIEKNNQFYYNFSIQVTKKQEEFVLENIFFEKKQFQQETVLELNHDIFNQYNNNNTNIYPKYIHLDKVSLNNTSIKPANKGIFIYGLGDYSRVFIAPFLKKQNKVFCTDYKAPLANYYKQRYKFQEAAITPQDTYKALAVIKEPLTIIATYHASHTHIAKEIFENNNYTKIFIEKPPIVTLEDLKNLIVLYAKKAKIDVGYNRRYIPINQQIKEKVKNQQIVITISVKEILINDNHWYFWRNQGTRITGNLTHWIDLATFWIDETPMEINLIASKTKDETIAVSVIYDKGSMLNITVSDKGNSLRGVQEKIEIRTEKETFFIDDYIKYSHKKNDGSVIKKTFLLRDKGHERMYKHVMKWYNGSSVARYSVTDLINTSLVTYYASKMYKENIRTLKIDKTLKEYITFYKQQSKINKI